MGDASNLETQELELRVEKLRCEVDELRRNSTWNRRVGQWLPLIGAVLPALALIFAVQQFAVEQKASRAQAERADSADAVANDRQFMRSLLDLHLSTYAQAANAAATLASATNADERQKAIDEFWRLYWGPMVMFEAGEVTARMMAIGTCLDRTPRCSDNDLRDSSLALAAALKREYLSVSNLSPQKYADRGYGYVPPPRAP